MPADIYRTPHRRGFGGVCAHGALPTTENTEADSDGNSNRLFEFRSPVQGRDLQLLTDEQYEKAASPKLNDSYEDLLELWQRLKATRARDVTSPFLESLNDC